MASGKCYNSVVVRLVYGSLPQIDRGRQLGLRLNPNDLVDFLQKTGTATAGETATAKETATTEETTATSICR